MKPVIALSRDKMKALKKLKCIVSDASMVWMCPAEEFDNEYTAEYILTTYSDAVQQSTDWVYTYAYTLEDLINKLPPTLAGPKNRIGCMSLTYDNASHSWYAQYKSEDWGVSYYAVTLMEAVYKLLTWVVINYPAKVKVLEK